MYMGIWFVAAIVILMASPLVWVAWWLLADLGETVAGRTAIARRDVPTVRHLPTA